MKRILTFLLFSSGLPCWTFAAAQTHKVAKPEAVVRAVGVYEWTGDLAKSTASRLIPVSLDISGSLEDAGVYMARPIPFALLPGNDYLLQVAGVDRGSLALLYARHLQTADSAYEDGWFGYGSYKPLAPPKKQPVLRAAKTPAVVTGSGDSNRPHSSGKNGSAGDQDTAQGAETKTQADSDPDRPHLTRKDDSTKKDSGASPGSDTDASSQADRPTMHRKSADPSGDTTGTATASGNAPADDPDRPTLKRHSTDEGKKGSKVGDDVATVTGTGSLNNDPDRPNLHRGKPAGVMTEADLPKLTGLPSDLHQMVAVSDAVNRPEHDFARAWEDDRERVSVLSGMQALATAQLASQAAPKAGPTSVARTPAAPHRASRAVHASVPLEALLHEELKGYTLSYGGAPTYVYTAQTGGQGASLHYVTIIAQKDVMGTLKPALQSATDAAHLDRTPRFRLVGAVDADASNRASLLFELRAQSSRQFALYQVIGARADQTLVTGSTQ
jgi:hypothetical protein